MNCKRSNESKMTCKRPHKLLLFQSCFEAICLLPGAHRNLSMVPRTDRETYFFQTENYTALLRVKRGAAVSHTLPVSPVLGPPAGTLRSARTHYSLVKALPPRSPPSLDRERAVREHPPRRVPDSPSTLWQQGYRSAAQRTGAELEESVEPEWREEKRRRKDGQTDGLSPLRQAGL